MTVETMHESMEIFYETKVIRAVESKHLSNGRGRGREKNAMMKLLTMRKNTSGSGNCQ